MISIEKLLFIHAHAPIVQRCFCRLIRLPVLPNGLQIMADPGFPNRRPLLVMPKRNDPRISDDMRRLKSLILNGMISMLPYGVIIFFAHEHQV